MMRRKLLSTVLFVMLASCGHEGHTAVPEPRQPESSIPGVSAAASQIHTATGSVAAVDRKAGQITITHDPVPSLGWSSMTMPFATKDESLLDKVQTGDKVKFTLAEGDNQQYVIQEIRRQ